MVAKRSDDLIDKRAFNTFSGRFDTGRYTNDDVFSLRANREGHMKQRFRDGWSGLGWHSLGQHLQSTARSQLADEHSTVALIMSARIEIAIDSRVTSVRQ